MAKIYYVGGSASASGILRCILPSAQLHSLIQTQHFVYVGAVFPVNGSGAPPTTILEVLPEERPDTPDTWQPGFYRAERPPLQFEETLRALECATSTRESIPV